MRLPIGVLGWTLLGLSFASLALVLWLASSEARFDASARTTREADSSSADARDGNAELAHSLPHDDGIAGRDARSSATRRLRGWVLDTSSGRGLAGCGVAFFGDGALAGETASDEAGRFALDVPPLRALRVRVICPYGWIPLNAPRTIEPDAEGEYEEVEIRVRMAGFSALHLQLVDELTREPVPHYLVRVGTRDGSRVDLWSDAGGVLMSEQSHPESTLLLFGYDSRHGDARESNALWYREFAHQPKFADEPPELLPIPVGPTYRLELDAPRDAPLERLAAFVSGFAPSHVGAHSLEWPNVAYVRSQDGLWVRFSPHIFQRERPGFLTLLSADGRWWGESAVSTGIGIDPRTTRVRLERRARILGRAVDRSGAGLANVGVALFGADRAGQFSELGAAKSSGNGLFEFTHLTGGRYVVRAASAQVRAARMELMLSGHEDLEFDFVLDLAAATSLLGVVHAPDTLEHVDSIHVSLRALHGHGEARATTLALASGEGRRRASFEFEAVAPGVYNLEAQAVSGRSDDWQFSASQIVLAPGPSITLELPGAANRRCVTLDATDARTGERVERADFELDERLELRFDRSQLSLFNTCFALSTPAEESLWIAGAPGYAPRVGRLSELPFSSGQARLEVSLERGWGALIEVCEPNLAPAAAVEVFIDGERVGRTDSAGVVVLQRAAAPRSLELRRAGWSVELASQVQLGALLRGETRRARVWISPG